MRGGGGGRGVNESTANSTDGSSQYLEDDTDAGGRESDFLMPPANRNKTKCKAQGRPHITPAPSNAEKKGVLPLFRFEHSVVSRCVRLLISSSAEHTAATCLESRGNACTRGTVHSLADENKTIIGVHEGRGTNRLPPLKNQLSVGPSAMLTQLRAVLTLREIGERSMRSNTPPRNSSGSDLPWSMPRLLRMKPSANARARVLCQPSRVNMKAGP